MVDQLAGVVAVEVTGGPSIDFVPGRKVSQYMRLAKLIMERSIPSQGFLSSFSFFKPGFFGLSRGRTLAGCEAR